MLFRILHPENECACLLFSAHHSSFHESCSLHKAHQVHRSSASALELITSLYNHSLLTFYISYGKFITVTHIHTNTPTHLLLLNILFLDVGNLPLSQDADTIKYSKWNGSLISFCLIDIYLKKKQYKPVPSSLILASTSIFMSWPFCLSWNTLVFTTCLKHPLSSA